MTDDIFTLLMTILLLENGGGTENINGLIIMFLLMHSRSISSSCPCSDGDGYTF